MGDQSRGLANANANRRRLIASGLNERISYGLNWIDWEIVPNPVPLLHITLRRFRIDQILESNENLQRQSEAL